MIEEKLNKFSSEIQNMYAQLKNIALTVAPTAHETLWAGLPSYYVGEAFIRLIPFKDHINIEAAALTNFITQLRNYKFTPKNMLQIFVGQPIPIDVLSAVFADTFNKRG